MLSVFRPLHLSWPLKFNCRDTDSELASISFIFTVVDSVYKEKKIFFPQENFLCPCLNLTEDWHSMMFT